MITTVVFDVGETLVDESRLWRRWADRLGVPAHVLFAVLGAVIERGEHHRRVFEILRPGFDPARIGFPDVFEACDLYPDAALCLHALDRQGLRIGVAGNQPEGIEPALEGLPVDFVASSARWKVEKPSPLFFQKLAEEAQAAPGEIAYVGDRLDNDILPALEAGMIAVFIRRGPWGYLHARRPEIARAHLRIESLGELPEALTVAQAFLPVCVTPPSEPSNTGRNACATRRDLMHRGGDDPADA
ncbi:HAD-superfamily hydrolase, subfamily IA, variant 1 [Candidatus Sulfopaludibacter sp. SbA4]|nr:HAD-superfamily hydrolase, subfamily IA, variant 1 [Candidatus Sulfopaludibacter sp. SbA4]